MSGLNDMVTKFEDSVSKYNINTTECMQKALCTYIQSTEQVKNKSGINYFIDGTLNALTTYVYIILKNNVLFILDLLIIFKLFIIEIRL